MNTVKFLFSMCLGMLFYVIATITVGQDGIWAYDQLLTQKEKLATNVAKIQRINDSLNMEHQAITQDEAMISSRARNLGLIFEGEKIIKINGISNNEFSVYDTGSVVYLDHIDYLEESTCKILGLIVFCLCMLVFFVASLKNRQGIIIKNNVKARVQI